MPKKRDYKYKTEEKAVEIIKTALRKDKLTRGKIIKIIENCKEIRNVFFKNAKNNNLAEKEFFELSRSIADDFTHSPWIDNYNVEMEKGDEYPVYYIKENQV